MKNKMTANTKVANQTASFLYHGPEYILRRMFLNETVKALKFIVLYFSN